MTYLAIFVIAILATFNGNHLVSADASDSPIVQVSGGKIRGKVLQVETHQTVNFFESIRYGKASRFEKPKPVEHWTDVYNATTFRAVCHQFGILGKLGNAALNGGAGQSEDCLFLSVWQPTVHKENRAVMVFIHGGAFEAGSSNMDAKDLAARGDVIIVALNYRLGPFGFMYGGDVVGNLGLHDQILALKWVNENIKSFGGDPNQVTIFGESAGSISVGALVLSPLTKGLFKRAIMQSGSPAVEVLGTSKARAIEKTEILAKKLGCPHDKIDDAVKCIRICGIDLMKNVSMDDFMRNDFFVPMYGDEVMPLRPAEALKTGKFNHDIDLMYGVTRDEGTIFAYFLASDVMNDDDLNLKTAREGMLKIMNKYNLTHQKEIADYYLAKLNSTSTDDDFKAAISAVFGDYALVCPTILHGEEMARHMTGGRFYSYRVTQFIQSFFPKWMGVTHGSDLQYLFNVAGTKNDPKLHQLSIDIIQAWTSFAKTGNPGKMGTVQWTESINRESKNYVTRSMQLEAEKYKMVDNFYKDTCDSFWKPKLFA